MTRLAALASGKATCGADSTSTGGGVTQIAVAGKRVAWIVNQGGNTESSDSLYTADAARPERAPARRAPSGRAMWTGR